MAGPVPAVETMPDVPLVDRMAWMLQGWDAVVPPEARTEGDFLHQAHVLLTMVQQDEEDRDERLAAEEG